MPDHTQDARRSVASTLYDERYFQQDCNGHLEFSLGHALPARLQRCIEHLPEVRGKRVLDLGCGRGEVLRFLAAKDARVIGVDYAGAAIKICKELLRRRDTPGMANLVQASAVELPLADASIDLVTMLDIVEHLYPEELSQAFAEARRILRPQGVLFIHTAPNLWYYRFGYPLYRLFRRMKGQLLPKDPKDRFPSHHAVHVNEQSPASLQRSLQRCGFSCRVWVDQTHDPLTTGDGRVAGWLAAGVTRGPILKWFFCGDVFALAQPEPAKTTGVQDRSAR
jgi:2-polyprenyl-3-methyl-5-hydroxy-6-metoxy-1,4-benzoquinol methylase